MLWILALPVSAVIAMIAYVLGYRYGKKVGIKNARREYESWREMRYCGTALLHMEKIDNEIGQREGSDQSTCPPSSAGSIKAAGSMKRK